MIWRIALTATLFVACAAPTAAQVRFIGALCTSDETAAVVARAVSDFASQNKWVQASVRCSELDKTLAQPVGPGGAVVLTSYSAVAGLRSLRVLNPHLIAFPTYLLSANPDALRTPTLNVGYTGGPLHRSRMESALLAARGNRAVTVREYEDSLQLLGGLNRREVDAVAVVGDDPGASLGRTVEAFRQATSVTPHVVLLEVDAADLGQVRSAYLGDTKYLYWTWAAMPLVATVDVRTAGGNALLEVIRSISTRPQREESSSAFGGGGWAPRKDDTRRQRVETTLDDLPVLLSTPNALTVGQREALGRVLAGAYLRAAFVGLSSGVDGCRKEFAESAAAAYLLNAVLENRSDLAASCVLWAHYELTGPTAQRRANKLNAAWLSRQVLQRACERVANELQSPATVSSRACVLPPEKVFSLGPRAPYAHAIELLDRALKPDAADRSGLFSEARACLIEAVKNKPTPTCHDPQYRGAYEPYLPLIISIGAELNPASQWKQH